MATVRVDVVPVNEFTPAFSVASYQFSVQENTALGTVLGSVNASDGDAGSQGEVSYHLLDPGNLSPIFIDPSSGQKLSSPTFSTMRTSIFTISQ